MARDEFERNKNVTDIVSFTCRVVANGKRGGGWWTSGGEVMILPSLPGAVKAGIVLIECEANYGQAQIKYLISTGKSQWDATERYIDGL